MKNKKDFLFHFVLTIIQFLSILFALILEYYSSERMGVARYLIYKKQGFETTIFTPALLNIYQFIFVAGTIIFLILLLVKAKGSVKFTSLLVVIFANIIAIIFLHIEIQLYAFHFFLIGIMIVILIQYVRIIFIYICGRK